MSLINSVKKELNEVKHEKILNNVKNFDYKKNKLENKIRDIKVNHILHLILSIITGGLWIIIWIFIVINSSSTKNNLERELKKLYDNKDEIEKITLSEQNELNLNETLEKKPIIKVFLKKFLGLNWMIQIILVLFILIYIPTFFMWTLKLGHYSEKSITSGANQYLYVGQKVPFHKWSEYGYPETLDGTNNKYWIGYLPNINTTFKSTKINDTIIKVKYGKVPNL